MQRLCWFLAVLLVACAQVPPQEVFQPPLEADAADALADLENPDTSAADALPDLAQQDLPDEISVPDADQTDAVDENSPSDADQLDASDENSLPEVQQSDANDGNSFPEVQPSDANDGNSFPEVQQSDANDGNSLPEVQQSDANDGNSFPEVQELDADDGNSFPDVEQPDAADENSTDVQDEDAPQEDSATDAEQDVAEEDATPDAEDAETAVDACVKTVEKCNGVDDDCDGATDDDDGSLCDDFNACTGDFCADGLCTHSFLNVGCNDDNACTVNDWCAVGLCAGVTVDCSDGNACTDDGCDLASGCTWTALTGSACSDGNACSVGDLCQGGACNAIPKNCDDNNPCTDDACDPATGLCGNTANSATCDDGNGCTTVDACQSGSCVGSGLVDCSAKDACHQDGTCNPVSGLCSAPIPLSDSPCSDGDACTLGDKCVNGACTPSSNVTCSAIDQCHDVGTCDPGSGQCSQPAKGDGAACDDGNSCTDNDTCQGGQCTSGVNGCQCTTTNAATVCDDNNVCTTESCTLVSGKWLCQHKALSGSACNDGDKCTQYDSCVSGVCTGSNPVSCPAPTICHSQGACDSATGQCSMPTVQDGTGCDDGNKCTDSDSCLFGTCSGNLITCSDGNPCTVDTCNGTKGCVFSNAIEYTPCGTASTCLSGTCTACGPGTVPTNFTDNTGGKLICAFDYPVWGNLPLARTTFSTIANGATYDTATGLEWQVGSGCTYNAGTAATQCDKLFLDGHEDWRVPTLAELDSVVDFTVNSPTIASAVFTGTSSDWYRASSRLGGDPSQPWGVNFATAAEASVDSTSTLCVRCVRGSPTKSAPAQRMTIDTDVVSDAATGLQWQRAEAESLNFSAAKAYCGTLNLASTGGWRVANVRELESLRNPGSAEGAILDQTAFPGSKGGKFWSFTPVKGALDTNWSVNFTTGATTSDATSSLESVRCVRGGCTASADCDDSNICTTDTCSSGLCVHGSNGLACDDGQACTQNDTCAAGKCKGSGYDCIQEDACHFPGTCNGDGTCSYAKRADGTTCDDNVACTKNDVCSGGICGGQSYSCAAPDGCHQAGTCNGNGTCSFASRPDGTNCDDGVACTKSDVCTGGVCGGVAYTCTPGICQTSATCNGTGCTAVNKANATPCDDGNPCTNSDGCSGGACTGTAANCDDGNACTLDSCSNALCSHTTLNCDDGSTCTLDFCNTATGCLHVLDAGQQAYVKASNPNTNDQFGTSVAISGDTMVVGAPGEDSANGAQGDNGGNSNGAVYVYVRSNGVWAQQAYLKPTVIQASMRFGMSVAISGNTLVVGAPWENSGATTINGNASDTSKTWAGAAYVFVRSGTTWTQQAYLKAANASTNGQFGTSVAISADTVIVGAIGESSAGLGVNNTAQQLDTSAPMAGAAFVFFRSGTTWSQQAYFKASNTGGGDEFGWAVGISGDTAVVSAYLEDGSGTGVNSVVNFNENAQDSGAAYIFQRTGTYWVQQGSLKATNSNAGDAFGFALAIDGNTIIVGARGEASSATGVNGVQNDNSTWYAGAAYVYTRTGSTWSSQAYLKASNTGQSDSFGSSIGLSGDVAVIGATLESGPSSGVDGIQTSNLFPESGAAYAFVRTGSTWQQRGYLKASNSAQNFAFGATCAASGTTVVCCSANDGSSSAGVNGDQTNQNAPGSGAAYVFLLGAYSCDDVNPCTADTVDATCACVHTAAPNATCDDGDNCTSGEICLGSSCKFGLELSCQGMCEYCDPLWGCQQDSCCMDPSSCE